MKKSSKLVLTTVCLLALSFGNTSSVFADETQTPSANSQGKTDAQKAAEAAALTTALNAAKSCKATALKASKDVKLLPTTTTAQKKTSNKNYSAAIRACNATLKAAKAAISPNLNKPAKPMKPAKPTKP
jgi:hypothetical protein